MTRIEMAGTLTMIRCVASGYSADINISQNVSIGNVDVVLTREQAKALIGHKLPLRGRLVLEFDAPPNESEGK